MTVTIALSGKGGVGKTTLAALLIKYFGGEAKKNVLAVDADPNANLDEKLGVQVEKTIGTLRENLVDEKYNLPAGISKSDYIEYKIRTLLIEGDWFDMVVMGRPEGPGCYCYVNSILRTVLDNLSDKYDYVIMDTEAGMEHLSRRTTRGVSYLLIVSDITPQGVRTAARIKNLASELRLEIEHSLLVLNRVNDDIKNLIPVITECGFQKYLLIPDDNEIAERSLNAKPILDITLASVAYQAVKKFIIDFEL